MIDPNKHREALKDKSDTDVVDSVATQAEKPKHKHKSLKKNTRSKCNFLESQQLLSEYEDPLSN